MSRRTLAVIPARAGSKGCPGKNARLLAGLPLLVHSLACSRLCPGLDRTIVSTDDPALADLARRHGGEVPFLRPAELAGDEVPMWPVLRHALAWVEQAEGRTYDLLVLLDPTSPTRLPEDVAQVMAAAEGQADAALTVSMPHFSPYWHLYLEDERGFGKKLIATEREITRRQECPPTYFINGLAYAWRTEFVRSQPDTWVHGRIRLVPVPVCRAVSIDTPEDFAWTERLLTSGLVPLPWLEPSHGALA